MTSPANEGSPRRKDLLPVHWTVWLLIAASTLVTGSYFVYQAYTLALVLGRSSLLLIPVTLGTLFLVLSFFGFRNILRSRKKTHGE